LFSIVCCKEASVANNMWFSNGNLQWNLYFLMLAQDWEVNLVIAFFDLLYSVVLKWKSPYSLSLSRSLP
jgi:hypothetical protein